MDPERRYSLLKELASSVPDFGRRGSPNASPEVMTWLGRLHALIDEIDFGTDSISVKIASDSLGTTLHERNVAAIIAALYRAIAKVELLLPVSSQGAFIPAGNAFDALAATTKILEEARREILIVDPYMGPKALQTFALQCAEGVKVALLGEKKKALAGLIPSVEAWTRQFGNARPISLRLAASRMLHDRLLIVDGKTVWDVSQSFEHLAARSPATLSKANSEQTPEKIEAYLAIYDNADVIF